MNWFKREFTSFTHTVRGVITAWDEVHYRYHVLIAIIMTIIGFVVGLSATEWIAQTIVLFMLIIAEVINTVAEEICNFVHPEKHPAIKKIKDMAGGAVLLSAICAIIVALIIYLPKFS